MGVVMYTRRGVERENDFSGTCAPLRPDASFLSKADEDHHKGVLPLSYGFTNTLRLHASCLLRSCETSITSLGKRSTELSFTWS